MMFTLRVISNLWMTPFHLLKSPCIFNRDSQNTPELQTGCVLNKFNPLEVVVEGCLAFLQLYSATQDLMTSCKVSWVIVGKQKLQYLMWPNWLETFESHTPCMHPRCLTLPCMLSREFNGGAPRVCKACVSRAP